MKLLGLNRNPDFSAKISSDRKECATFAFNGGGRAGNAYLIFGKVVARLFQPSSVIVTLIAIRLTF